MSRNSRPEDFTPLREVLIDGLAVLKMVKHVNDNLPGMSAGSLLGLDVDGVLEVTYAFPNPPPRQDSDGNHSGSSVSELEGSDYQIEMMKMLRDVGVDNNCVGWYQSMYLGQMSNKDVVAIQYSYQNSEDISENSVVIMYDPIQSKKGTLVIKAYRLSDDYIASRRKKSNAFIRPTNILQELPVKIRNSAYVSAFIRCLQDTHKTALDCDFDPLSMAASETYMERHLELLGTNLADMIEEQYKLQQYTRTIGKPRQEQLKWLHKRLLENADRREEGQAELPTSLDDANMKPVPEAPSRTEHLLMLGQLEKFTEQLNEHVETTFQKLVVSSALN